MLRINNQIKISEFSGLYERIIPKDNILRRIKENIDFSFINEMLKERYCEDFGRPAKEPEMMLKLQFLKCMYDLSDEALVDSSRYNMAYKFFLDLNPEDEIIDPSLLTKFRKKRITKEILEKMLKETIRQAIEKGLIKSHTIIVDSTHSKTHAKQETPTQILRKLTKEVRKEIYKTQLDLSYKFPDKPIETADLNDEIIYSKNLIEVVSNDIKINGTNKAKKLLEKITDLLSNDKIKEIQSAVDEDAKLGYKSEFNSFFGYKNHLAMTEDRLITGAVITTGEANDGIYLQELIEQSVKNGIVVDDIIGDKAYSGKVNLDYMKEHRINAITKLNAMISSGNSNKLDGFEYNKDADTYRCPQGYLAMRKCERRKKPGNRGNISMVYNFSIKKCKLCPRRDGCYKSGSKNKTYTVAIAHELHLEQKEFQESDYFKEKYKSRYMIEAKNSELKQCYGLEKANSTGVKAMRLQTYFTIFVANTKRILKLIEKQTV